MSTKDQNYQEAVAEIRGVVSGEPDLIANLSNIAAIIKQKFNFW